jgi:hypothetical protein
MDQLAKLKINSKKFGRDHKGRAVRSQSTQKSVGFPLPSLTQLALIIQSCL